MENKKIAAKLLTAVYILVIILSFLEVIRGDFMDGIIGFIIAFGMYKFVKFISWKEHYIQSMDNKEEKKSKML